jgi:5'-3' exonuclease
MAVTVHLVDGTYELFRAYFARPSQRTKSGAEVAAARGVVETLLFLHANSGATHIACAFDHVIESFRNELFAGYKTGEGLPSELTEQFPLVERAVAAFGIVVWPMIEFEADDALATAAARFASDPDVERVVICSPDKDLLQCVRGTRVVCWDRQRERVYDEAGVEEKLGVAPPLVPDFLALVGDSADGIPGIPRWGKQSAAKILSACGGLEAIPETTAALPVKVRGADALLESLRGLRSEAALYKQLATLRTDVPLTETLDELRYRGASRAAFEAICAEMEAERLLGRVAFAS